MTIQEATQQLIFQLFHLYDDQEATTIADWVMEHITGWKKIDRIINKKVPLSQQQEEEFHQYTKELLEHKPVQYVLHEAWFYKLKFYVDENVLIPRPETEELVQWVIEDCSAKNTISILDIGTGSGCIPLALKKNLSTTVVHSCDVSEGALRVAARNADSLALELIFHKTDILSAEERKKLPEVDIIVSNPPYIPLKDKATMSANVVDYEPHLALFVANNDPLLFYKAIADFALDHLKTNGVLYLELHEDMSKDVAEFFSQKGFTNIIVRKDLQGKERMIKIAW